MTTLKERLEEVIRETVNPATGKPWGDPRALSVAINPSSPAYIGMVIRGDIGEPRKPKMRQIAKVAGVSYLWLSEGVGARNPESPAALPQPPSGDEDVAQPLAHVNWHDLRQRGEKRARREGLDIEPWAWDEFERLGPQYAVDTPGGVTVAGAIRVAQGFSDAGIGKPRTPTSQTGPQQAATGTGAKR